MHHYTIIEVINIGKRVFWPNRFFDIGIICDVFIFYYVLPPKSKVLRENLGVSNPVFFTLDLELPLSCMHVVSS